MTDKTYRSEDDGSISIECPCCGCDVWTGRDGDIIEDGQPLECGCKGHMSCDSESEPHAFVDECLCSSYDANNRSDG